MELPVTPSRRHRGDVEDPRGGKLPRLPGVFVTSPGARVGKTIVAGAIARHLRRAALNVEVFKPVATRCRNDREQLVSGDADFLAACAESKRTLAEIAPVRTALDLPPSAAGEIEHRPVDVDDILQAWRRLAAEAEVAVVEGTGGLLCPITDELRTADLASMLALPLVIVVRARAAAVEEALLTLDAARAAGLRVAGVVVNRYRADAAKEPNVDLAMAMVPGQIARHGQVGVLALVPDDPANNVADASLAPSAQFAIDQVDWQRLIFGMMNDEP